MKLLIYIVLVVSFFHGSCQTQTNPKKNKMSIAVWDTYVPKKDGSVMHFDILAPVEVKDTNIIYGYGKEYLKMKGQEGQPLTAKQCRFCHVEKMRSIWEESIAKQGYYIIEMENCN